MRSSDRLSRLALVASDMAYAANQSSIARIDAELDPYDDSPPQNYRPLFSVERGFVIKQVFNDAPSGLKGILFVNAETREAIVSFAGTDGLNAKDWATNSLHLGWNQWDRIRSTVLPAVQALGPTFKLHFTGQSLGGALAQYAAYDFLTDQRRRAPIDTDQQRVTVTTFNGLGATQALVENSIGAFAFSPAVLANVSEQAAYVVRNDIVSRLGGGQAGMDVYRLDHRSTRLRPASFATPQSSYWDLDSVAAHRVEPGLYNALDQSGDFQYAKLDRWFAPFAMTETQRAMKMWGAVFNTSGVYERSAHVRIGAALVAGAALGNREEVNGFARELWRAVESSGALTGDAHAKIRLGFGTDEFEIPESAWAPGRKRLFEMLESVDWATALRVAALSKPGLQLYAGFVAAAVGLERNLDGQVSQAFEVIAEQQGGIQPVRPMHWEAGFALGGLFLRLLAPQSLLDQRLFSSGVVSPHEFAQAVMGNLESPIQEVQGLLLRKHAEHVGAVGTDAGRAKQIAEYVADIVLAMDDLRDEVASIDAQSGTRIALAIQEFVDEDVGQAIVNRGDVLDVALLARGSAFGEGELSADEYRTLRAAFYAAAQDLRYADIREELTELVAAVDRGGELVAIREQRNNPFTNGELFSPHAAVNADLSEGQVSSFHISLPYRAGPGGQRIRLAFAGADLSALRLTWNGESAAIDAAGKMEISVVEGTDGGNLTIGALGDVDSDSSIGLSAQILDSAGIASHESHLELNLSIDATVEPSVNPANIVSGTTADDNRNGDAAHRPINGTAAADHLRALAGRDEAYGNAGDDVIEGGAGADVLTGGDGNDRLYADALMTDAALRSYIGSAAAIVDNTDAPLVLSATTADWLVGGLNDDTVVGTAAADILLGGGGSDLIVGGAGHDIIDGDDDYVAGALTGVTITRNWGGNPHEIYFSSITQTHHAAVVGAGDEIHAGAGDDFVTAQMGDDTVFGDNGDDTISGDSGNDTLFGGAGNDRIAGDWHGTDSLPSGDDYIDGGDGNDILHGEGGADVLFGGAGDDVMHGFIGTTFVGVPNDDPSNDGNDYLSGGAGTDQLVGHGAADMLLGGDGNDQLFGDSDGTPLALHGNDTMDGGAGNDYLRGYGGDDELLGGEGDDTLQGEEGADYLDGGAGDDLLFGMAGDDTLLGDSGTDEIVGGAGSDRVDGGGDDDAIWGEAGDDELHGGYGDDYLDGGEGNDTISGGGGADRVYAMAGNDVVSGGADADELIGGAGADDLAGNDGDDRLWGEADDDTITGDAGNDQLIGGDGNDRLDGGDGLDQIFGEAGDDTLTGGAGRDYLLGGAGNDVYLIDGASAEDVIIDNEGQNTIRFGADVSRDELRFRQGIDAAGIDRYLVIEGGATFSRVIIHSGMDAAIGRLEFADGTFITHAQVMSELAAQNIPSKKPVGSPPPTIRYGTTANDTITGLSADDHISARAGDDVVIGGAGADKLEGGDGADRLDGGTGNDTLIGGPGTDVYVFGRDRGRDAIEERFISQTGTTQLDTLELLAGVAPADVTLHRDGGDLVVAINQTASQLRVRGHFLPTERVFNIVTGQTEDWPADHRIEQIQFADGTVWDSAAIVSRTLAGVPNALTGTLANDVFTVDHADDVVTEAANAGDDMIQASVSYALRRNVERLTLTGFVDLNAWSTPGNPTSYLTGNAGNNVFNGPGTFYNAAGQSVGSISGAAMGYAVMAGGAGDDTYHLRDTVGGQVIESLSQGYDTVVLNGVNWYNYQLPANVEALVSAEDGIGQLGGTRYRTGNALDNYIEGTRLGIPGTSLDNVIDGGVGADTMVGFNDNDRFIVDNAGDVVIDQGVFWDGKQQSASDEIHASISYELPDNIEILRLTGAAAIDGHGNDLANTLDGTQNAAINRLAGGLGNDLYRAGANDVVEERPGEGIDTVEWNGTGSRVYTADDLPANIEGLAFGEDLGNAGYSGDARADRVTGNSGMNNLSGGAGDDVLKGGAGNDTLIGGAGNDQLDGGTGHDFLHFSRGFGHDTIYGDTDFEIVFDATIPVGDLLFVDGELRIAGSDDRLEVGYAPSIRFADGTFFAATEVFAMLAASRSTTPTDAADMLTGTAGADVIDALGGDDFVYGRDGADALTGGDGDDRLYGEAGNDALRGDAGNDRIEGDAGDDVLEGGAGNDTVHAGGGHDDVDGGPGNDTLHGDDGDDRIAGGGGLDSLHGGAGADVLTLAGGSGYAAGDAGDDRLIGGAGYDTLWGGSGNDHLEGGGGDDTLSGDVGVDTYVLAPGGGFDHVQDPAIDGELTVIEVSPGFTPADIALERIIDEYGSSTLRITGGGSADGLEMPEFGRADRPVEVRFSDGTVWTPVMVMNRLARVEGTNLDDVLTGTTLADLLFGLAGNDTLAGLAGDDFLDGGTGADWMEGGEGSDRYVVDDGGDTVVELAFEGVDSVESTRSMTLAANVENLTLVGAATNGTGNAGHNTITGNAAANLLDGKQGTDTLIGGAGNDTYVIDSLTDAIVENANEGTDTVMSSVSHALGVHVEHLTLTGTGAINATGNAAANQLTGNAGANLLDGRAGADMLRGAAGNDTYVVDTLADVLIENAGEGTDTVQSSVSLALAANFENLTLTGAAAINGTGNAVANTVIGNAAANVLDGGACNDSLRGGAGNDTYVVDATADVVVENAGEGTDTVNASVSFTLGNNLENLTLTGAGATNATGNALANMLTGNAGANTLNGGAGNDTLRGGAGNDVYVVDSAGDIVVENAGEGTDTVRSSVTWTLGTNVEHLTLTGTAAVNATGNMLANTLTGNAAANVLNGAAGADAMSGGAGNDTYVVDNALDSVTEAAAAGIDLVRSSVSVTLAANVENLTLTGTSAISGTGNALANAIQGNAAANALDGGAGADTLRGGAGDDVLTVDNAGDVVIENASQGDDTVRSYIAWTLGANLENLTLAGTSAANATGNTLNNWLRGNVAANTLTGADGQDLIFGAAGNDTLNGGNGRDILQGGDGNDTIVDAAGNNVLHGGLGADVLTGGAGSELYLGGAGSDTVTLGAGADIIGFNRGDGQDIVNACTGTDNTLSLGGGIKYADVALRKSGNDLVVDVGATESLTLRAWYLSTSNAHVVNLQMVVDASAEWNAGSPNALYNKRVARFDFAGLVAQFDAARAANPALTQWSVAGALASEHLGGSDMAALGGDLGYQYGHSNTLAGIGWTPADSVLASAVFGTSLQTLQSPAALFSGPKTLG